MSGYQLPISPPKSSQKKRKNLESESVPTSEEEVTDLEALAKVVRMLSVGFTERGKRIAALEEENKTLKAKIESMKGIQRLQSTQFVIQSERMDGIEKYALTYEYAANHFFEIENGDVVKQEQLNEVFVAIEEVRDEVRDLVLSSQK